MSRDRIEIPRAAFPLAWPPGVARCKLRESARFHGKTEKRNEYRDPATGAVRVNTWKVNRDLTVAEARDDTLAELTRLSATTPVIISTNLRTRLDGLPAGGQAEPSDPGVAVYFMLDGHETCIAIDRFDRVADNLRAVAKTIEAMRGIERWGGASLVAAAFTGFQGLPAPGESSRPSWTSVLGLPEDAPLGTIEEAARMLLATFHPDKPGGDGAKFNEVVEARADARAARREASA